MPGSREKKDMTTSWEGQLWHPAGWHPLPPRNKSSRPFRLEQQLKGTDARQHLQANQFPREQKGKCGDGSVGERTALSHWVYLSPG